MGTKADPSGVTLDFIDPETGKKIRKSVHGKCCQFFSSPRPVEYGNLDSYYGSQDWLTHVFVTDSSDRLAELATVAGGGGETSFSSKEVQVVWWVGNEKDFLTRSVTIAQPSTTKRDEKLANRITVLPRQTDLMKMKSKLRKRWVDGAKNLLVPPKSGGRKIS